MTLAAVDEHGNPVANVEVELLAGEMTFDVFGECGNPPVTAAENLVFFDATVDPAGTLVGCPEGRPVLGQCGSAPLRLASDTFGRVNAGVILGDSPLVRYAAEVRAAGLASLTFQYSASVVANSLRVRESRTGASSKSGGRRICSSSTCVASTCSTLRRHG